MTASMFRSIRESLRPPWNRRNSPSEYQPLRVDHGGERDGHVTTDEGCTVAGDGSCPDANRDAAALMLIKLGRSPDERIAISPADDARILRRVDLALLPIMLTVYFLQALDKATLSYASLFGLIEDTHLVGDQFSWLGSIVFLAQLVMQLPLALALVKLPIGKFTSAMVLAWGISLTTMTWAHNFRQLMIARFFLGAFEASVGPSFVAITQMWWRRREQTMRVGWWYCMNGMTWVFGSLITILLVSIDSKMKPYQIIFLFFGVVTVFVAALMFYWMPDSPTEARFLTDDDKVIAIERLRDNQMGIMSREWRYPHFFEALLDLKTWFWVLMIFCISVPSSGISTFGPQILQTVLSDPKLTTLMNMPVGVCHVIAVAGSSYLSMKVALKGPIIVALCIPPIIGLSIFLAVPPVDEYASTLLAAYFCLSTFTGITPLIYSWSAQNTAGDTKRKSVSALVFIGSSAGNIIGPLLFRPDEAPFFTRGIRANLVFFVAVMVLAGLATLYLSWLNRKHAQMRVALGKRAVVRDYSLMSAQEVDRLRNLARHIQEDADEDSNNPANGDASLQRRKTADHAFSDATDLENEDFIFVY